MNHVTLYYWSRKSTLFVIFAQSLLRREVLKVTKEVTHTEASARCFAGVRRSDALLGCSNAFIMKHKQKE